MSGTVTLHRIITAKPDKVYRAFVEPDAVAAWLPPFGFTCAVEHFEPKEGGKRRLSFRNFTRGNGHSFGGTFLKLVPGKTLVYTDSFDDPNLPGEVKVTVTLKAVPFGTELQVVQEGLPDVMPVDACYLGWQESLRKLAKLVEPEIADE
jgi:uncharacterized protein YndB with AHSA1/START domain